MGDFNHGHIQWKYLESIGCDDQQFIFLFQGSFLTQTVLESTREENVLNIANVKIHEPLGNSGLNQIHVDINVKSESKIKKKHIGETSTKVTIKT